MSNILLKQHDVILPEGSASHKLALALKVSTDDLNSRALRINKKTWEVNRDSAQATFDTAVKAMRDEAGVPDLRPGSNKDLAEVLQARGVELVKKTKTGFALDKTVLLNLAAQDKLPLLIVEAREAQTKLSQLDKWKPYAEAGEVHARWDQDGTPHGRYTSKDPCLNNRIREIRETIEPRPGCSFLSLDLGMAEYVTFASLTGDPTLNQIFEEGRDLHQVMGDAIITELSESGFDPTQVLRDRTPRELGKTVNFAILYRMTAFALAGSLQCPVEVAEKILKIWWDRCSTAQSYIEDYLKDCASKGQTRTKFGRTRIMRGLATAQRHEKHELEKTAWHHHNAGTAAEILNSKQVRVFNQLRKTYAENQVRMALNMYDEVILEVQDEILPEVQEIAERIFREQVPGFLPFPVDVRSGKNWLAISK